MSRPIPICRSMPMAAVCHIKSTQQPRTDSRPYTTDPFRAVPWGIKHRVRFNPSIIALTTAIIATLAAHPAAAQSQDADEWLSPQRWQEHSHGISLRPPRGSRLVAYTADNAVVRIYGPTGYTIRLYIKKSLIDLPMDQVVANTIHQTGGGFPSATILEEQPLAVSGRPAAMIYFRIPDPKRNAWVMGQTLIQLNPRTIAVLQLEADLHDFDTTRQVYEAVVHSFDAQDPKQLDQIRATQLQRTQAWRAASPPGLAKAILPEQWLRIVENGTDIGYMSVKQQTATTMGYQGVRIDVRSRIHLGNQAYDSISNFFVSDDRGHEFWSTRTTARPWPARTAAQQPPSSWAETGVRSKGTITVSLERPSGIDEHQWQTPPAGYLSQAEVQMIDQLLLATPQPRQAMGFYAYYPAKQKIAYRTTRIEKADDGSFTLHTRPSPEQAAHVSHYSPDGRFLKRALPGGRMIFPATKHELNAKWRIKSSTTPGGRGG